MNRSTIICWALVLPIAAGIGAKPLNAQFKMDEEQKKLMENQQLLQHLQFIAQNPMIQKELEIVPDQLGTLGTLMKDYQSYQQKIMMEYQKEIADARSAIAEGDQKKAMEIGRGLQKKMNERTSEIIGELEETLLPHQLRRLRQLARQQSLKYQSGYNDEFGVPYALADELELTKKQKEKLKQTIEDARKDYQKKLAQLKKSTRKRIMEALPQEKRDRYHELLGEPFDFEKSMRSIGLEMSRKAREAQKKSEQNNSDTDKDQDD